MAAWGSSWNMWACLVTRCLHCHRGESDGNIQGRVVCRHQTILRFISNNGGRARHHSFHHQPLLRIQDWSCCLSPINTSKPSLCPPHYINPNLPPFPYPIPKPSPHLLHLKDYRFERVVLWLRYVTRHNPFHILLHLPRAHQSNPV